jgi:PAS domain S-box-containing protein
MEQERIPMTDLLKLLFEAEPVAKLLVDASGTILLANERCGQLFGYPCEALRGERIEILVPERFRQQHVRMATAYASNAPVPQPMGSGRVLTGRRDDGSEFDIEVGLAPVDTASGRVIVATVVDASVHKQLQSSREALDSLASHHEELQQFARAASHDLREPLRKVAAFSERLAGRLGGSLDDGSRDDLSRILSATARMQRLIDALLNYSRAGGVALTRSAVNLNTTIGEVLSDLSEPLTESDSEIVLDRLPIVAADPVQMQQLFQNLLANSVKFASPGRRPRIEIRNRPCPSPGFCRMHVVDNGIGFDPRQAERIFEPFQRLHGTSEYQGAGIGLATVRRIVDRLGGRIIAFGEVGAGSTFELDLPIWRDDDSALP